MSQPTKGNKKRHGCGRTRSGGRTSLLHACRILQLRNTVRTCWTQWSTLRFVPLATTLQLSLTHPQLKIMPEVESIDMQTEIQWYMRPYIIDFLIEAHAAFALLPETLFLTINILDRYCSKRIVYRRHYQLVGCTALWIACKHNESPRSVPHLHELANMCCQLYEEDMFVQMERHVLATLEWFLGGVTVDDFLRLAVEGLAPPDPQLEHLASYIAEMAAFQRDFVSQRPSEIAKAALYLAQIVLDRPSFHSAHWAANHDSNLLVGLSQLLNRPSAVLYAKYKVEARACVALIVERFLERHAAIAQANAARQLQQGQAPPTPPSNSPHPGKDGEWDASQQGPFATPQKNAHLAQAAQGCLTPPITPENEHFGAAGLKQQLPPPPAYHNPQTPMPHGSSGLQQHETAYYLPEPVMG